MIATTITTLITSKNSPFLGTKIPITFFSGFFPSSSSIAFEFTYVKLVEHLLCIDVNDILYFSY